MSVRSHPGKIQLLSEETINQIAAGEVIENPASVVKELIENALDAGSTKITIEIKGGGLQLIRISDDGCGMSAEDAVRAFVRYATSKIQKLDDLLQLVTMGFRGEALAAISSIAKITLRTATHGGEGTQVEIEPGKTPRTSKCARTHGTTIEVSSLFYNVPARKKFQKSAAASAAEITRMISLLALAHPHVAFEYLQQDRELLSTLSGTLEARIQDVLGEGFLKESLPMAFEEDGISLQGVISQPPYHRPSRAGQHLFINNRPIYSPAVSYAVKDGYGTRLPIDRYPAFVLHLKLSSDAFDVNVHPQKREVRLYSEKWLKEKIQQAISRSFQSKEASPPARIQPFAFSPIESAAFVSEPLFKCAEEPAAELFPVQSESKTWGILSPYLFLEKEGAVWLVDLAAAYRRVLFDSMTRTEGRESQGLIFPLTFTFSTLECAHIREHLADLEELGIAIRPLGGDGFIVDALPPFLAQEKVRDYLLLFAEGSFTRKDAVRLCAQFASQRKEAYELPEAVMLYHELLKTSAPYTCPEGKPTMKQITSHELAKFYQTS